MFKLYNTLTRKKQEFKPLKDKQVGIYGCGPTVYWYQHIGNLYRYVFEDILVRTLLFNGYKVKHIINITDVGHLTSDADEGEDKMVKAIKRENLALTKESMLKIADKYTKVFKEDLKKLNILEPDKWPKATEHIKEQIELIKKLEKNGFTYKTSVGLIFDTSKFRDYGKLAKLKLEDLKAGSRVKTDDERKNKSDFALWITNQPNHIMQWDSPWGRGFPGWHIECSAMSMKYLGEQFDIHTGGEEHIPVHHTNEIAQSEAATGKKPWVKYWLHLRWLVIDSGKMSKSLGNVYQLSDLEEKGFEPLAFRYFCLTGHYRKNLNFTINNLKNSQNSYNRLKNIITGIKNDKKTNKKYLKKFEEAINDDLNLPLALQILWELARDKKAHGKLSVIKRMDEVLGLDLLKKEEIKVYKIKLEDKIKLKENLTTTIIAPKETPKEIISLVRKREELRKQRKWQEADVIREKIRVLGYKVDDTKEGSRVSRL
ncbi:cysteine--tRNA ligase [Candidatus Pacearchaeota archaeon]|nr:cysteine--tRNA ligase [Candidatus Pacearchaeota archaeon]MBD3283085.1 cysteine--tRNA ligase [Candidatus Pacearchaeota archaeon]